MKEFKYLHKAQYYETDQMGVIHHSNYIRWFEEARIEFLKEIGYSYDRVEKELGLISPVLEAGCRYRKMMRFGDVAELNVKVEASNGIRLKLVYEVRNAENGELCADGFTSHCFLSKNGKPASLKKAAPGLYDALNACVKDESGL